MKPAPDTPPLIARLTTLSDMARLRLMRLLEREELTVGELARAVQLPQSTVSRHLKMLHQNEWIHKRAAGTASLYRLDREWLDDESRDLWEVARDQIGEPHTLEDDDARLVEVLAERRTDSKAFFGRIGGEWDQMRHELFGEEFTCEALLSLIDGDWVVADLGCGTGNAAELLSPVVRKIIAVDRESAMLEAARRRLSDAENVDFRAGEMTSLPIDDAEVDAAMTLLVLHHLADPSQAVREIARTLTPGGVLMIVDMVAHDREDYHQTMGHLHLGFDEATIRQWANDSGLDRVTYRRLRPDTAGKGPGLFVATLRKAR